MRTQVRWFYSVITTTAVLAALQQATAPVGTPDPALEAKFEGETLIVTLTNRGTGPSEYPLRGYAEAASDLDPDSGPSLSSGVNDTSGRPTCGVRICWRIARRG